jgi:phospholipid/cholesterol/gamma-HCH transport system substrate-binding protein
MLRTAIRARWARIRVLIRVLITVLVALSILSTLTYVMSGGGLFKSKATLRTFFEDSGALEKGAEVDLNGVKIGTVNSVNLSGLNDPARTVEVRMRVYRRFLPQIPDDSKSEIVTQNVLGDKFIEITSGKSPTPVQDNGALAHVPATNVYVRIDTATFAAQLRSIDATLKDIEDGKGDLGQFVMTDKVYADLLAGVTKVQRDIEAAVSSDTTVGQLLYSPEMYEEFSGTLQRMDASLAELQAGRSPAGKFLRDPQVYDNARESLAGLRRSVKNAGDSGFVSSDDLYQDWNQKLAGFIRDIDDFNAGRGAGQMVARADTYESLVGAMADLQSTLKDFRTNPRKYLKVKLF